MLVTCKRRPIPAQRTWLLTISFLIAACGGNASAPGAASSASDIVDTADPTSADTGVDQAGSDATGDGAVAAQCKPDSAECVGQISVTCSPDGSTQTKWDCSADGLSCVAGHCKSAAPKCVKVRPIAARVNTPATASVAVVFAVNDCEKAPVIGLGLDDFHIREDDKLVSPTESSATILPRPAEVFVAIALDNSASIGASGALEATVDAAKQYVEDLFASPSAKSIRVSVAHFSKKLEVKQVYTHDKAKVLAAIDSLLTDPPGGNTTNLFGALSDVLDESTAAQASYRVSMDDGITTLGQVVMFTDGSDQAAVKTFEEAQAAVAASTDDVVFVAVGGEIEVDVIEALGRDGAYIAKDKTELAAAFKMAAKQTAGLQQRLYVLGYCSPKLQGVHKLTIEVGANLGKSPDIAFDATGFDADGPQCSATAFAQACDGKACGGLWCGACGIAGTCKDSKCACELPWAGDHCAECEPHFSGSECEQCAPAFKGEFCVACANPLLTGFMCDECIDANFAPPDCKSTCAPAFTGSGCKQCSNPLKTGDKCSQCADPKSTGPACDVELLDGMATIPAGTFKMGCTPVQVDGQASACSADTTLHSTTLKAFRIDVLEVTYAKYKTCIAAGKCGQPPKNQCGDFPESDEDEHPVHCVTWKMAKNYCEWAGGRLPTEAEWERAARGGLDEKPYPWGAEEPTCKSGQFNSAAFFSCSGYSTKPVGTGSGMNGYGLYDTLGNVAEWTNDWYGYDYYASSPQSDPQGPDTGLEKVLRGGDVVSSADANCFSCLSVYARASKQPLSFPIFAGIRCAKSLP